jgi:hypothetical protein
MGHLYYLTDDPNQGLDVAHLAEIWGLFARSCLLYGSEIWSAPSASALESLEVAQTMAGRQILGKPGNSNITREALYGDLGWLSIRSYLRSSKLRFFGRLLRLPNDRLAERVSFYQLIASTRAEDSSPYLTYLTLGVKTRLLFFALTVLAIVVVLFHPFPPSIPSCFQACYKDSCFQT